jgi:hypothetical protein
MYPTNVGGVGYMRSFLRLLYQRVNAVERSNFLLRYRVRLLFFLRSQRILAIIAIIAIIATIADTAMGIV